MSYFAVTVEEIAEILPHPNADRLAIATLRGIGFRFIVGKDTWKPGDKCLYFPLDAILPDSLLKALNLEGKLAGAKKNRVKTIKLRGEISQGLVGPLSLIANLPETQHTPEEITKFLEVVKYEPEISLPLPTDARLVDLPEGVGIYDVENVERYPGALAYLMEQPVYISEKLEGSHFAIAYVEQKLWVCQRRFALEPLPDKPKHFFWELTEELELLDFAKQLVKDLGSEHLVLRGEFLGPNVQKNIYRFEKRTVRFFDLLVDRKYTNAQTLIDVFTKHGKEGLLVPTISIGTTLRQWLAGRDIRQAATAESALYKTLREGIIIRPMQEQYHEELNGRLILKQISPEYLAEA